MIPIISWRNIWRNRTRSLVVILAIMLGVCGAIFLMSFSWGMNIQRTNNIIETQISHIQIHHPQFPEDEEIEYTLTQGLELADQLTEISNIAAASPRVILNGMAASAQTGAGVKILGIYPEQEKEVTTLQEQVIEGDYFESIDRNPIVLGHKLAEKLQVKLRSKVVLTFQDRNQEIVSGAFRISGIFKTINSKYDESHVFVQAEDLQRLLGNNDNIHEIAILVKDQREINQAVTKIAQIHPDLRVEEWKTLAPDLKFMSESFDAFMRIFMIVIMLALAFGIINTMLMAVLERTHELGMLMAIGMNKLRVFLMIMLETLFLSVIGGITGLSVGYGLVTWFGHIGVDLSSFEQSLSSFGMNSIIYTELTPHYYRDILIMVFVTAILSSVYPAMKALQLNPAEAIRSI